MIFSRFFKTAEPHDLTVGSIINHMNLDMLEMSLGLHRRGIAMKCAELPRDEAPAEFKKRWTKLLDEYDMQYGIATVNHTLAELGFERYEEPLAI